MTAQPNRPVTPRRTWRRYLAAAPLLLLLAGLIYQSTGQILDRLALDPPGGMIGVGGSGMHLHCTGSGSPTVLLEAGAVGFAQTWGWIQPRLAAGARVCSYDRAGLGWSEEAEAGHDAVAIARRLHELLERAGEPGPYVLVGHSLGGVLVRVFAGLYGDEVVGMALIDPAHPDQLDRFPAGARQQQDRFRRTIGAAAVLAPTGLLRATNFFGGLARGLPPEDYRAARLFGSSAGHLRTAWAELDAWDSTMSAARRAGGLGDRPLLVVSATATMDGMPEDFVGAVHAMHRELVGLSARGRHELVAGADHYSLLMDRAHAGETARLVQEVVEAVSCARMYPSPRSTSRLNPSTASASHCDR